MTGSSSQSFNAESLPPWQAPAIMLMDLDAFFASVEQLDHPEWRKKPVIVGGSAEKRGVVSTCSYEARKYGVHSAMASARAAKLCPDAIWTHGNFKRYNEMSAAVMQILQDVSPHIQQVSIDEAFLDISPGRYVKDHPVALAWQISSEVSKLGISCSIGLGTSKSVAKIASDIEKPNGLTIIYPGCEQDFLFPLPIKVMSGVGAMAQKRLHEFGIYNLGQLANADATVLASVFGKNAQMIRERCLGINDSEVQSGSEVKSVSNEMTFAQDLSNRKEIENCISTISAKVGRRLRKAGLAGYTVGLKVRYEDLSFASAQHTLDCPVDDEHAFIQVLFGLLDQVWQPSVKLRLIGVSVTSFAAREEQLSIFDTKDVTKTGFSNKDYSSTSSKRSLVLTTDKVKDRFGESALKYGRDLFLTDKGTNTPAQKSD